MRSLALLRCPKERSSESGASDLRGRRPLIETRTGPFSRDVYQREVELRALRREPSCHLLDDRRCLRQADAPQSQRAERRSQAKFDFF